MRRKTVPAQPQPRTEDVQIVELPVDDVSETTTPSIVTVTQPDETPEQQVDQKLEEEIIVLEENQFGEVSVAKTKKSKKKVKRGEEIIVEIEEREQEKKVTKKKITAYKPTEDEEINEEETIQTLQPLEVTQYRELLLETPSVTAETVPTRQVSEIFSQPIEGRNVDVNVIPLAAVSEEFVLPDEKEQHYDKISPTEHTAKKSLSTSEAYQVSEETIQNLPSTFESTFKPTFSKATRNVTEAEGISVSVVHESHATSEVQKEKLPEDTASVKFFLQEATSIIETEAISGETALKESVLPKSSTATEAYRTNESVAVEEVQDVSSTVTLDTEKLAPVKSKINVDAIEPLIVEEVYTDNKPGKHLPESFVPTEYAHSSFIPQKQIVASETIAPELEGEFIPGRLPPSQTAAINVTVAEGLLTEQIQTDDKEGPFSATVPDTTTASSDIILSEGLTVSVTDTQMPSKEIAVEETQKQTAEVEILVKESLSTSTVITSETGGEYKPGELPEAKTAATQIICLEVGKVSDVTVQESEQTLDEDLKPTMGIAEAGIKPAIPLQVSEVSTADIPEDFTDYPKYRTQEVSVEFETQDATQITETQPGELEKTYEETPAPTFTLESSFTQPQDELMVSETRTMERESVLPEFELPDSYRGKQISTHVLPTSVTEEVTPEATTSHLTDSTPESKIADVTQTALAETVVSQTVPDDSLGAFKEMSEVDGKHANVTVTESESINVTEVLSDEKEKECTLQELPKQYEATIDIDTKKAASTAEVLTNLAPEELLQEKPQQGQAKPEQMLVEGVQILQFQTAEKENEYTTDTLPDSKQAVLDLTSTNIELKVSETIVHESESEYVLQEKPKGALATEDVTTQEVAIKSETEMVSHTDEIIQEELVTGKAKKYARPLQELIVTEPTAVDFHKDLPKDIFPFEKKANVNLIPGQQVTVTEVVASDKEENLQEAPKVAEKHASTDISTREVALQEETLSHLKPEEFTRKSPEKDTASTHQDVVHHLTELQFTVGEKEGDYTADVKPDSKVINVEFEEGKSINVTEVQTQDKETSLEITAQPDSVQGQPDVVTHPVAIKSEVAADDSITSMVVPAPKMTEASVNQTLLESLIQTEVKVEEKELKFEEALPDTKAATSDIVLGETVTVSTVVAADKEKVLEAEEKPKFSQVTFDVTQQTTTETTEIQTGESLAFYETKPIPDESIAKISHTEQHSIVQSETTPGEVESDLPKDIAPDAKVAEFKLDSIDALATQEVVTDEKEQILPELEKPVEKSASEHIDAQPVAETTETVVDNAVSEVEIKPYDTTTANVTQSSFEGIISSDVVPGETEVAFEKPDVPTKKANINFSEGKTVDVTEITVAESEEQYTADKKPVGQLADTTLDTVQAIHEQEVSLHEDLGDLTLDQPRTTAAEASVQPLSAIIGSESIAHESESEFRHEFKADTKTAQLSIGEDQSVIVETVEAAFKESSLKELEIPEQKQVETDITDLKSVATTYEVLSDSSADAFAEKPFENVRATMESIPFESIKQLQHVAAETEGDLTDYKAPDYHTALVDLEPWKSLEISEVTPEDSSREYTSQEHPSERSADVGLSPGLQVIQKETTVTSDGLEPFKPDFPEKTQATRKSDILSGLVVSEDIVHESEKEFVGKPDAVTSTVDISIEQGKVVQNVTEIITQEREIELKEQLVSEQQSALVNIDSHKVAETEEVVLQSSTNEFEDKKPTENIANIKATELESVIQLQPEICESEEKMDATLKTTPKEAEVKLEETISLHVSEVTSSEKESLFEDFTAPQTALAEQQILPTQAMVTSEVHSTFSLDELPEESRKPYSANITQDYLEGLTNTETLTTESEQIIKDDFKPDTKIADVSMTEMSSVAIQETYAEDGHKEYAISQTKEEQATELLIPLAGIEGTQVVATEDVRELFNVCETKPSFVNIQQTTLESIALTESTVHEKEAELESFKMTGAKTANTIITEHKTIDVTEVFGQEKEDLYEAKKITGTQQAIIDIISQHSLQQQQIETADDVSKFEVPKLSSDSAISTYTNLEAIAISENILHEQEARFDVKPVDEKTADVEILTQTHVCASETIPETKEGEFERELIKTEVIPDKSFIPQTAVEVIQTISDHSLKEFSYEIPEGSSTEPITLPYENIIVTDLITSEKENILPEQKTPRSEIATGSISATGAVAFTTVIASEDKEQPIPSYKAPQDVARLDILKQTPLEEVEVNVLESFEDLPIKEAKPSRKATSKQTMLEGVTQTEVAVQEKARYLDTEFEDSRTAELFFTTSEGITVTEVNPQEQESEKVITGTATEKSAQSEIQEQKVAITEEIVPLLLPGSVDSYEDEINLASAKEIAATTQYGLVVSEQRSTGELESVPSIHKPDSKKGRIMFEDATATPIISEIQLQEKEGKYLILYLYLLKRKMV